MPTLLQLYLTHDKVHCDRFIPNFCKSLAKIPPEGEEPALRC
ncbi:hypothetical protein [Nostoc sp.]